MEPLRDYLVLGVTNNFYKIRVGTFKANYVTLMISRCRSVQAFILILSKDE